MLHALLYQNQPANRLKVDGSLKDYGTVLFEGSPTIASNITMALSLLGNELLKNVIVTTNKKY